jgi:hypothetical protein
METFAAYLVVRGYDRDILKLLLKYSWHDRARLLEDKTAKRNLGGTLSIMDHSLEYPLLKDNLNYLTKLIENMGPTDFKHTGVIRRGVSLLSVLNRANQSVLT